MSERRPRIVLVVLFALASEGARADETLGASWRDRRAPVWVYPNFPDVELAGDAARQVDLIRCAAGAWTDQTRADFVYDFRGEVGSGGFMRDGVNTVAWADVDGNEALAATCFFGEGGDLTEFDILFFGRVETFTIRWSGQEEPGLGTFDIFGVAVHELGHGIGLGHVDDPAATMYAVSRTPAISLRTLNATDQRCVEDLYGLRTMVLPSVAISAIEPPSGPTSGGNTARILGTNFTIRSETDVLFNGRPVQDSRWVLESCDRIRITEMPSRDPGTIDVTVVSSVGVATAPAAYEYVGSPLEFVRGDANADGALDISDTLEILGVLFVGQPLSFRCDKSADVDDSGGIDLTDAVAVLDGLFLGGPPPGEPFPDCGADVARDELSCDDFPPCP